MRKEDIKTVMIYDQSSPEIPGEGFCQCMGKIRQVLQGQKVNYIRLQFETDNPHAAIMALEREIAKAGPELVIIPATALGEEAAPALGIRLGTGVAAHCSDITINGDGRIAYMVPAFGGKVIGEIFIPQTRPAIATVKPGVFAFGRDELGEYEEILCSGISAHQEPVKLIETEDSLPRTNPIEKADIIFCGGFGIGSADYWAKLQRLAELTGGAAGCTRPVVDMNWGPDEQSMIGTSGKTVRPKLYIGFGISGAAHHLCGIRDSGTIVNINCDDSAESLAASDFTALMDAGSVIDILLEKLETAPVP
ncbi:MAG: electron transfer flavoprotein subunit alpha/FixB family protein [Lentihominibacter sp.]